MNAFMRLGLYLQTSTLVLMCLAPLAELYGQPSGRPPVPTPPANIPPTPIPPDVQNKMAILRDLRAEESGTASRDHSAEVIAAARTKIKRNDLSGAEAILGLGNPFTPGTSYWSLHTGGALVTVALELSREYDRPRTALVITRALQHLDQAAELARQAGDMRSQAAARTTAAFLHERFRGDATAAIASYRIALQLDPGDQAAQQALERLERSVAILRARVESRER